MIARNSDTREAETDIASIIEIVRADPVRRARTIAAERSPTISISSIAAVVFIASYNWNLPRARAGLTLGVADQLGGDSRSPHYYRSSDDKALANVRRRDKRYRAYGEESSDRLIGPSRYRTDLWIRNISGAR